MTKVIDFQTTPSGNDSGKASTDSISPIQNGEQADQATLSRPDEVLRARSEALRIESNEARWLRDNDRSLFFQLSSGGSIAWGGVTAGGGTGALALSSGASLIAVPGTTPGEARGDSNEGGGTRFPTRYATATLGTVGVNDFTVTAVVFDFDGSFNLSVETVDSPGAGAINIDLNGEVVSNEAVQPGLREIVVQYDSGLGHTNTTQDIVDAINADGTVNVLVSATTGTDGAMVDLGPTTLTSGGDGLFHEITDTALAAFFAATSDNELNEGDTLAIWYSTVQNRRESVEENSNEHLIPGASLVNLSAEPEKAPDCVVVGRVVDDSFTLADGGVLVKSFPVTDIRLANFGLLEATANSIRADYERPIAAPPASGVDEGAKRLGIDATPFVTISTALESQQEFNEAVDTEITTNAAAISTLQDNTAVASSVHEFIAGTTNKEVLLVKTLEPTDTSFYLFESTEFFGAAVVSLNACTDGRYVYLLYDDGGSTAERRDLTNLSVVEQTYATAVATAPDSSLCTNGAYFAVADGTDVELYNASTGASVWTYTSGSDVYDMCMDDEYLFLVLFDGTVSRLDMTAGSATDDWAYAHGAALISVCTDGFYVYVAGSAGTGSFNVRALTNKGAGSSSTWDYAFTGTTGVFTNRAMKCDPQHLWLQVTDGAALGYVLVLNKWSGEETTESSLTGLLQAVPTPAPGASVPNGLAVDQDYVAYVDPANNIQLYGKRNFGFRAAFAIASGYTNPRIERNGDFFILTGHGGGTGRISLLRVYRHDQLFRRLTASDQLNVYRLLATPLGDSGL